MSAEENSSEQQIGHYRIKERLSQQRVSDLYVAHDLNQDCTVYLEVLRPSVDEDADLADRFQRGMETASRLEHPNVAPILGIGVAPATNQIYAAIKYTPGSTLAQKLAELREQGESLTVFESLKLVRRIADSLIPAHAAGIVHHDLRPENIIIREGNVPLLVDLGVPAVTAEQALAKQPIESIDYAPPEQWQGKELSGRSNIYSLGVILYELLAGHRPHLPVSEWDIFERDSLPKEIPLEDARPGLTAETYQLVRDCLWRQEWSRFDTIEQMVAAVDAAFAAEQRASEAVAPPPTRPRWLYVAAVLVILAVLGVISLLVQSNDLPDAAATPTSEGAAVAIQPSSPEAVSLSASSSKQSSATATPLATSSPASPDTTPQPPTTISLLGPPPNSQFTSDDEVLVEWIWSSLLEADQQFAVYLTSENEPSLVGTVTEPYRGNEYRLEIQSSQFRVERTDYEWQVILEQMPAGERVAESERRSIRLVVGTPTPTPSPIPDATDVTTAASTVTVTPTITATETACVRTQPFAWQPYTVQSGDALSPLAYETGTSVERVREVNCLDSNILSIGQVLWLPPFPPTPTPTATNTSVPPPTSRPSGGGGSSGGGSSNPPQPTRPPSPPTPTPPPPP